MIRDSLWIFRLITTMRLSWWSLDSSASGSWKTDLHATIGVFEYMNELPLARTDQPNQFVAPQILSNNPYWFEREHADTAMSGIPFRRLDDPVRNKDGSLHFYGWIMDWAMGAYYCAWYDSLLDEDVMKIGVDGDKAGRFSFGYDPINADTQVSVHDLEGCVWSISTWSQVNGIRLNSRAKFCDAVTVQRDDTPEQHWYHYHQGSGVYDWRWGMAPNSYDFVVYSGQGQPTSAAEPGLEIFRLKANGDIVNAHIARLEARVAELEKRVGQKDPAAGDTRT
jgi:hypothetical protein